MGINRKVRKVAEKLAADATDAGAIIALGFVGYWEAIAPEQYPEAQYVETRKAFFAGAMHWHGSRLL
jgi:hypothetical protein